MVTKLCPKCEQQVPVACKSCRCGHIYFQGKKPGSVQKTTSSSSSSPSGAVSAVRRRRTERLRQVRVNRESRRDLAKVHKTSRPQRAIRQSITNRKPKSTKGNSPEDLPKKRRGRKRSNFSADKESAEAVQEEPDAFANIPPEKALRYSIILAEINRKIGCNLINI